MKGPATRVLANVSPTSAGKVIALKHRSLDFSAASSATVLWSKALVIVSLVILAFVIFHNLGSAALIEPDEGRNAEKAREILITHDWVTPQQDFVPVLDKPMAFYWLTAGSYRLFGISESSARLPSALAALATVVLVYCFSQKFFGDPQALWSSMVLASSAECFILSRVVIFDSTLNLFLTAALCCFYAGFRAEGVRTKRRFYLSMYAAMAFATLVKGLLGVVLPGMVIVSFLVLTEKRAVIREMQIPLGALLFALIVTPWYAVVEARHPGYLYYFLWKEHFLRFTTAHFHRTAPWYYFLGVLPVGVFPWTFLLPGVVKAQWKSRSNELILFLGLWTVLPLILFSLSRSKLPHYILPMFPPLAILVGTHLATRFLKSDASIVRAVYFVWAALSVPMLYLAVGSFWPALVPPVARAVLVNQRLILLMLTVVTGIGFTSFVYANRNIGPRAYGLRYLGLCLGLAANLILLGQIMSGVSLTRSAKLLAESAAPFILPQDQVVFYDIDLEGLPYYLAISRPAWIVSSGSRSHVIGSFYLAENWSRLVNEPGRQLLTYGEFARRWKESKERLLVFMEENKLSDLAAQVGDSPRSLLRLRGPKETFVLVTNR